MARNSPGATSSAAAATILFCDPCAGIARRLFPLVFWSMVRGCFFAGSSEIFRLLLRRCRRRHRKVLCTRISRFFRRWRFQSRSLLSCLAFPHKGFQRANGRPSDYAGLPSEWRLKVGFGFVSSVRVSKQSTPRTWDPYGVTVSGTETTASSFSVAARDSSFSRRDSESFNPWPFAAQISDRKHSSSLL
jgi:hypothetical protein